MIMKISGLVFTFFISSFLQAFAGYYPVELIDSVDKNNLPAVISVRTQKDIWISDTQKIQTGGIIKGQVKKVVPPRRLERDAYISFVPVCFDAIAEDTSDVILVSTSTKTKLRYPRQLSKRDLSANTIGTALSLIPPFTVIVPMVQFTMGIVNPKVDEHPFKAGCRYLVESWPFCYFLKGKDIPLTAGSVVELYVNEKIFAPENLQPQAL